MSKASDANLDFNGQAGDGVNREKNKWAGNFHGGQAGGNYGAGPRKGNTTGDYAGPCTASEKGGKINGGATVKQFAGSPDKINVGK
jgi:hypothetical protein